MLVHHHCFQKLCRAGRLWWLGAVLVLLCTLGIAPAPGSSAPSATSAAPMAQEEPTVLVPAPVQTYTLAGAKIFWTTVGQWVCGEFPVHEGVQSLNRVATYGSPPRQLFLREPEQCEGFVGFAAIVADDQYIYFLDLNTDGLFRLSTNANVGDAPELLDADWQGLAIDLGGVYGFGSQNGSRVIKRLSKTDGSVKSLTTVPSDASFLSSDGKNLYWRSADKLMRYNVSTGAQATFAASGVTSYYATGDITVCNGTCTNASFVYVAQGNTIIRYVNGTTTSGTPFYLSPESNARIYSMTADKANNLFFFEQRTASCPQPCFPHDTDLLIRIANSGGPASVMAVEDLGIAPGVVPMNLTTDGTFVFWNYAGIKRLPTNADALPLTNMRITGMEVTQGIQSLNNSVRLIQGRRTFVRVYVQSDGPAVPGVTMYLVADAGFAPNVVHPSNDVGTHLTVPSASALQFQPNGGRDNLNNSFLFELPWTWTEATKLTLHAVLNPYNYPVEATYTDNESQVTVTFKPSPTFTVEFFNLNYTIGTTTYTPRLNDDMLQTFSWIMRTYPIGGAIGQNFNPELWDVDGGTKLGSLVDQSSAYCAGHGNLCASFYTNGLLNYYRAFAMVPNTTAFYYGMISDAAGFFPRGQASGTSSVGPSGAPCTSPGFLGCGWDVDSSYADWYAGHEIGHSLGRPHPASGSDDPVTDDKNPATDSDVENCGHSRSGDLSYEHGDLVSARAPIGPADGSVEGFDVGDPAFGIQRAVYPGTAWNDLMSYCDFQWMSDYTYEAMYTAMINNPTTALALSVEQAAASGDFLLVSGSIDPATNSAAFALVRRMDSVAEQPPLVPGDYSIRLLDGTNALLANTSFTPLPAPESAALSVNQVVRFVAGARTVEIVRNRDGTVLASRAISPNPPLLSNIALQGARNPVTGIVTLGWTASDPDGDALTFDIFYSRDNGATFQPVKMDATGASTPIDTATLGGSGTAILRVVANDGVHTTEASSAPFTMASKPPEPYILSPSDGTRIHWGQLVNFNGMAFDAQDGTVAESGFVWKTDKGVTLGTGPLVSADNLPVGVNKITLTATNSARLSASASVTVIVDDDLNLPGPTLSVGPTQIGWQVAPATTTPQTAQLTISNAGSGNLNWTASSDQPWLTVSPASGTVTADGRPATLTLTANPAGLQGDKSYAARLTITKPANGDGEPAQTVVIPVSLSIGNTREPAQDQPPTNSDRELYLPFIQQ